MRAAISVNLQPAAVTSKIGGTVAHLRRCMGRRTSARGTSDMEGELTLGTSSAAYFWMHGGIRPSVGAIYRVNSILTCTPYIYGGTH